MNKHECDRISEAIEEAYKSPVLMRHGCVAVKNGKILARGFNHYRTFSRDNFINSVIIFPIIQVFLKILPLYTLYKYKLFKISKNETRSMIYLLIVYFIYIYLFKREQTQLIYNKIVKEKRYIISDEPAPFTVIIRNIFN